MRRPGAIAAIVAAAVLLLELAWVAAMPPFRGMDELDHVYRATAVADGQLTPVPRDPWSPGRGDYVEVPRSLVAAARPVCDSYWHVSYADCHGSPGATPGTLLVASGAARYHPAFYAVVGLAGRGLSGADADYAMRLLSAVICAGLVGLAVWAAARTSRTVWPVAGVVLALTPTVIYSASTPAPNAVEMLSGLGLWAALLALRSRDATAERPLLLLATLFAVLLATPRTLGPLWLALVVVSAVMVLGRDRVVTLFRAHPRLVSACAAAVTLATVLAVWWSLSAGTNSLAAERNRQFSDPVGSSLRLVPLWILQSIGAFPDRPDPAPNEVYGAATLLFLSLLALAATRAVSWSSRLHLVLVCSVAVGVQVALSIDTYSQLGGVWQGRYALPYALGIPVLAGFMLEAADVRVPAVLWAFCTPLLYVEQLAGPMHVLHEESVSGPMAGDPSWRFAHPDLVLALVSTGVACFLAAVLAARGQWRRSPVNAELYRDAPTAVAPPATRSTG